MSIRPAEAAMATGQSLVSESATSRARQPSCAGGPNEPSVRRPSAKQTRVRVHSAAMASVRPQVSGARHPFWRPVPASFPLRLSFAWLASVSFKPPPSAHRGQPCGTLRVPVGEGVIDRVKLHGQEKPRCAGAAPCKSSGISIDDGKAHAAIRNPLLPMMRNANAR